MKKLKKGQVNELWGSPPKGWSKCDVCGTWGKLKQVGYESFWDRIKYSPLDLCDKCYDKIE